MPSIKNNYSFQLAGQLLTTGTSVAISNDIELNEVVTFESGYVVIRSGNKIERTKGTAAGGVLTFSKRGLNQSDTDTEVSGLKKDWQEGTTCYVTVLASQVQKVIDLTASGGFQPPQMTTAERDALTPAQGLMVANTTTGTNQMYQGGAWADVGTSTTPNMSETVSGKGEQGTDAEFTAGTLTGGTGATLLATLVQLAKSIFLKPTTVTTSDSYYFGVNNGTVDQKVTQAVLRDQIAASTTQKGFVEMATDAEAIAGTDETRYTNSKQLKNRSGYTVSAGGPSIASSPATTSGSTTGDVLKSFNVGFTGSVALYFDMQDDSNNGSNAIVRLFKNNVDTTQSVDIGYSAGGRTNGLGFSVSVSSGDNLQLRVGNSNVIYVRNAYLAAQITPVSLTATVVL